MPQGIRPAPGSARHQHGAGLLFGDYVAENFKLNYPVIFLAREKTVDPKTGMEDYHQFLTINVPGKGACSPIFQSRNATQMFFSEQNTDDCHAVNLRHRAEVVRLVAAILKEGVKWIAIDPNGHFQDWQFCQTGQLLWHLPEG